MSSMQISLGHWLAPQKDEHTAAASPLEEQRNEAVQNRLQSNEPLRASDSAQPSRDLEPSGNGHVSSPDSGMHGSKRQLDDEQFAPEQPAPKRPRAREAAQADPPMDLGVLRGEDAEASGSQQAGASSDAGAPASEAADARKAAEGDGGSDGGAHAEAEGAGFVAMGTVRRSVQEVVECLACDLCYSILRDPITAPDCMHTCAAAPPNLVDFCGGHDDIRDGSWVQRGWSTPMSSFCYIPDVHFMQSGQEFGVEPCLVQGSEVTAGTTLIE